MWRRFVVLLLALVAVGCQPRAGHTIFGLSASAAISIADGAGSPVNQSNGQNQLLGSGDIGTFALQSTAGVVYPVNWVLSFTSPNSPQINGQSFYWDSTQGNATFSLLMPPGGFTGRYSSTVYDANKNPLSQYTGTISNTASDAGGGGGGSSAKLYYGDGADGNATFDGTATPAGTTKNSSTSYTLNRPVYYLSATISNNVVVSTNCYPFYWTNTLTLNGGCNLDISGGAGAAGTGSGSAAGGTAVCSTTAPDGGWLGAPGTVSGVGVAAGGGNGAALSINCQGGAGGNAGTGGGTGGTCSPGTYPNAGHGLEALLGYSQTVNTTTATFRMYQGGAAGGGGINTGNNGGGSGAGGGVMVLGGNSIAGSGNLCANGGAGGNATSAGSGGGGGGGGYITGVVGNQSSWTGACQANGGAGGTGGAGAGSAGTNGKCQLTPG